MRYCLIIILCSVGFNISYSQDINDFNIYYAYSKDEINWNGEHKIDSVINRLSGHKATYYASITGYSDSKGTRFSNKILSSKRAKKVADYFVKQGFRSSRIIHKGMGYRPSGDTSSQSHRKTHIRISLQLPKDRLPDSQSNEMQKYSISSEFGGIINLDIDGHLIIPSDAFMNKDSSHIYGNVTILYKAYRTRAEFIDKGISLIDNPREIYSSTGAFEIRAYQLGQPVYLKPGKSIRLIFGLNERRPLLNLYQYNPSDHLWTFNRYLTNENGEISDTRSWISGCGGVWEYNYCSSLGRCERLRLLVNTGLEYSSPPIAARAIISF